MLINLIKPFQSAAERFNVKQAHKLNDSIWGKSPGSLFRVATEHHYLSTLPLHVSGTDLSAVNTAEAVAVLQCCKFKGSSLNTVPPRPLNQHSCLPRELRHTVCKHI